MVSTYQMIQDAKRALDEAKPPEPVCPCGSTKSLQNVFFGGWSCGNGHAL